MRLLPLVLAVFLLPSAAMAQDSPKIDTLLTITRDIQKDVKSQVESKLGSRKFGIEIAPSWLLASTNDEFIFRGGFSYFGVSKSSEIYIPVQYYSTDGYSDFFVDAHYREYLSGVKKGFFIEGIVRYVSYEDRETLLFGEPINEKGSRIGVGFGIGTRVFAKNGLYWGMSLAFGKFLTGDAPTDALNSYPTSMLENNFIYAELLRIGFAF
jgi:hypothetical protein